LPALLVTALVIFLFVAFSGCAGSPSVLAPSSPQADQIAGLFWALLGIAAVVFVVTEVLLIVALVRFRDRAGAREPDQIHGNVRLETAWTLAPALIVAGIFVATVTTMNAVAQPLPGALQVKVIGHQWWWEIQYPGQAITTATDLHVPVGTPVDVELAAADVIHSFWVPELAGKTDAIPGHTTFVRFTAGKPGTYDGFCAEFCGTQHANMRFLVIAEPREQFDDWVKRMQAPAGVPAAGQVARGAQAVVAGICAGCHTIDGTQAQGKVGPNLTHFGSRQTIGAVSLQNTPENLAAWLSDPQAVKPGNLMRIPKLSPETIQDIIAYLETLK
jgi:cytochrome c oxidase subunit 2